MIKLNHQNEVIISAFLIDFERFYQEEPCAFIQKYQSVFAKYCNIEFLQSIQKDLKQETPLLQETRCIKEARAISLTQTDTSQGKAEDPRQKNLTSVFFRVNISNENTCDKKKYQLAPLTPDASFPVSKETIIVKRLKKEQQDYVVKFEEEMNSFLKYAPEKFEHFLIPFEALLKKYLWCITASDYECEDISLYDHARITAAIASCMYRVQGEQDKKFKLVAGNFSGIQKYIFSLSSFNTEKVAKKLRARSFFVDAIVNAFAQTIIDRFSVPRFHILMLTGGKFYILLPNVSGSGQMLEDIEHEVESELFERFKGQLSTNLAYLDVSRAGLEQYDDSISELSERLNKKKKEPFHLVLADESGWEEEAFVLEDSLHEKKTCESCRTIFIKETEKECESCQAQGELGGMLPNSKYYVYYRGHQKLEHGEFRILGDYSLKVAKDEDFGDAYYIERIEDSQIAPESYRYPITFEYRANHIPLDKNGVPESFDNLSGADGKNYVAVLKADVDNLGYIFSAGLKKGNRHYGTISRVNTMSRLLTVFFSGKVQEILRERVGELDLESEYDRVYSVFAGGDDLFLIGPWQKMQDLAKKIHDEFERFVCGNKDITLSATIDLYHPKTHIATMAHRSEEHLEQVKNDANQIKKSGRNGIQYFGQILGWEDYEDQLGNAKLLANLMKEKQTAVDTTLLRRVCEYSEMYQRYLEEGDASMWMFKSKLYYTLGKKEFPAVKNYIENLKKVDRGEVVNKDMYYASSTMKNTILLTRE